MEINSSTNFNSASNFQSNVGSGNGFNASSLASGSQSSFGGVDIQKLASSLVEALLTGNFSPELLKDLAKLLSPVDAGSLLAELDKLFSGNGGEASATNDTGFSGTGGTDASNDDNQVSGVDKSNDKAFNTGNTASAKVAPTQVDASATKAITAGSNLPARAPDSASIPQLEAIAKDPVVAAAIEKAWNNSNPNTPGGKQEQGFWVMRDDKTGALSTVNFPSNGTRDSLTPGAVPAIEGKTAVAFFHTHPNTAAEGYKSGPSPADQNFADANGIPGIIRSHDGMYYFGANN